jgi:hypothetical protein
VVSLANLGERHVPSNAVKEFFPKVVFHQPDLVADRRRSKLQLGSSLEK